MNSFTHSISPTATIMRHLISSTFASPFLFFLLFSIFVVSQVDVGHSVTDTFHEGEYVGLVWHMAAYYAGNASFPLIIHGGMDFIPSLLAKFVYGDDRVIVGTRVINSLIVIVTWSFFLDLCWRMASKPKEYTAWIAIPIIFILLASRQFESAVDLHHAFIGPRDLFLILTLWSLVSYEQCLNDKARVSYVALITMASTFGIYWSYDRGIMALLSYTAFAFSLLHRNFKFDAALSIVTAIAMLVIMEYSKLAGSIFDVLSNILHWIRNGSEIWQDYNLHPISTAPFMLPFALVALIPLVLYAVKDDLIKNKSPLIIVVALLIVIEIILIKTIFNRPGLPRSTWGLWPLIVLLIYGGSRFFHPSPKDTSFSQPQLKQISPLLVFIFPAFILSLTTLHYYHIYSPPRLSLFNAFVDNARYSKRDINIVSGDIKKISEAMALSKPSCAFGWTNEGVIPLLARLPLCTKFSYAIYSSNNYQSNIINELSLINPSALVFDTPNWSIKIDDKPMSDRLPYVFDFILKKYPHEVRMGAYTLRTQSIINSIPLHTIK